MDNEDDEDGGWWRFAAIAYLRAQVPVPPTPLYELDLRDLPPLKSGDTLAVSLEVTIS